MVDLGRSENTNPWYLYSTFPTPCIDQARKIEYLQVPRGPTMVTIIPELTPLALTKAACPNSKYKKFSSGTPVSMELCYPIISRELHLLL